MTPAHIVYHPEFQQGSVEWLAARCGLLTASEMHLIVTPTLQVASNDKERAHLYELLAQRITQHVEPRYLSDDMMRGHADEIIMRRLYEEHCDLVQTVGFVVNTRHGFPIGYSPDGLVGDDGLLECKSRRQKFQIQTIIEHVAIAKGLTIPVEYALQVQTGLLVTERAWLDFVSYSGGLHMPVIRVYPDEKVQTAILAAARGFEKRLAEKRELYGQALIDGAVMIPTERIIEQELI